MATPPRRRWFQFKLRTMFVVVTLVALPLGWIAWEVNAARTRLAVRREIELSHGDIFDGVRFGVGIVRMPVSEDRISTLRRLLGDRMVHTIYFPRCVTPDDMERASHFPEACIAESSDSRMIEELKKADQQE